MSITLGPSNFSFGDEVTISGTDTGTYPDGSTAPVAGQVIQVSVFGDVTTDAAGNYSVTVQAGIGTGQYLSGFVQARAEADATADSADSADIPVPLVPDPARISNLHVSSSQPAFGAPVTVTGVAQYLSHGTGSHTANRAS